MVWQGHPMAGLDKAIEEVIAGKLDMEKAKNSMPRGETGSLL